LEDARLAELALVEGEALPDSLPDTPAADQPGTDISQRSLEELIVEANAIYTLAQTALREGDWTGYGTQMDALQIVLERLAEVSGIQLVPVDSDPAPVPAEAPETAPESESEPEPTATPTSDG
jgi:hypothetical protein